MGWKRIAVRQVDAPAGARIYEIDGAQAWAELCRRFPLEVTTDKRHDWCRTTGRSGRWVIPNWQLVAESYTGVHLTVMGYLAAAGTAIGVDDETASVIAGWRPTQHAGSLTPTASATNPVPGCSTTAANTPTGSKKRNNE